MEVIVPVPQALLAFGSWRLASLPPSACRQTGFNGRQDSMANWIQWQTGFNGKLDSMANWGTEWTPNHFQQSFSHVTVIWASAEQFCSGAESGKTAVMRKPVQQQTRASANRSTPIGHQ